MQILSLSNIYCAKTNKKETTVATYAAGQAYTFERLRQEKTITFKRYNRILQWFSDNWPADLAWPMDIPRPTPTDDSPAARALIKAYQNDPLISLNENGTIADPAAFIRALPLVITRNTYDQAVKQYGRGGPRFGHLPRKGTGAYLVVEHLIRAGDLRFTTTKNIALSQATRL